MPSILNKKHFKQMTIDMAGNTRKKPNGDPQFTRVSSEFIDKFEAECVCRLREKIHRHPSVGTTLKG